MAGPIDVAFVEILPDYSKLEKQGNKQFKKAISGIEKAADDVAQSVEKSFKESSEEVDKALSDVIFNFNTKTRNLETISRSAAENISKDLGKGLKEVNDEVKKIQPVKVPVEIIIDPATGQKLKRDINGRLRDERGKFVAEGEKAGGAFGGGFLGAFGLSIKGIGKVLAGIVGGAATGAATGAAASIAQALVPVLALLGSALPAAIAVSVLSIGTLALAFSGFNDVLKNLDDPEKFAKALEKLSPAAQRVAISIRDLVPVFDQIKFAVQEAFFSGLDQQIRGVAAALQGTLKPGLSGIASEFNLMAKELGGFLQSAQGVDGIRQLLQNTKDILSDFTPAIRPLAQGLTDLANAAAPILRNLTGGIAQAAAEFGNFLSEAAKSGQLQEFLKLGLATLGDLGLILKHVGSIFSSVFGAANADGKTLLANFAELTGTLATFLKSAEGSAALKSLFEFLGTSFTSVLDVVKPLLPLAGKFLELLGTEFTTIVKAAAEALKPIASAIADSLLPVLPEMIRLAKDLAPVVSEAAKAFGEGLGNALRELLPVLAEILLNVIKGGGPFLKTLLELFVKLAPVTNLALIPITLLAKGILLLQEGIKAVAKFLGDIDWAGIGKDIGGAFSKAWTAVKDFFAGVGKFFSELPGKIGDFLSSLPGKIADFFNKAFDNAIKAIGIGIGLVLAAIIEVPPLIIEKLSELPDKLGTFFSELWTDAKKEFNTGVDNILVFLSTLPERALTAILTIRNKVGDFLLTTIEFWKTTISNGWNNIIEFIKSIPDKIGALKDFFLAAGKRLITGFLDGLKNVGNFIGDVAGAIGRTIIGFINRVIDKLNEGIAEVDSLLPGSIPRIPRVALASGGLVTGPTNALVGERGDEFVLPLQGSRAQRAAEALGITGNQGGNTFVFEDSAIVVQFSGVVPTEAEAFRTGRAAGMGLHAEVLERERMRTQVRTF